MPELTDKEIEKQLIDRIANKEKGSYGIIEIIDNNVRTNEIDIKTEKIVMKVTNKSNQGITIRLLSIIKNKCNHDCKFNDPEINCNPDTPENECIYKYDSAGSYTKLLCPNESVTCEAWRKPSLEQMLPNDTEPISGLCDYNSHNRYRKYGDSDRFQLVPNKYTIVYANNPNVVITFKTEKK